MRKEYQNVAVPKGSTIGLCSHCGERMSAPQGKCATFCPNCKKASDRHAMDEENKKIFEASGMVFKCDYCG